MSVRRIKITPKLIELEDAVIRVPNIATVSIGPNPASRLWIGLLVAFAMGAFLFAFGNFQTQQRFGRGSDGSDAFVGMALAIGALLWAYSLWARIALFISTSDGKITLLVDQNPAFMREVMARIREALVSDENAPLQYIVNITAERVENHATTISNSAGATVVSGDVSGADLASRDRSSAARDLIRSGLEVSQSAVGAASVAVGAKLTQAGTRLRSTSLTNSPGGIAIGGSMLGGQVSTNVVTTPSADVAALMDLMLRHQVEHAEMFNSYLALVQDHLAGGQTSKIDARNYWLWFVDQAGRYVTGLNGAADLMERVSRVFRI